MRKRVIVAGSLLAAAVIGLVVWPTTEPLSTDVPPALRAFLTSKNQAPANFNPGPPPVGTTWTSYNVPLPYPEVQAAMAKQSGWAVSKGFATGSIPRSSYEPQNPHPFVQLKASPGRIVLMDSGLPRGAGRGYTVVMIAEKEDRSWSKRFLNWLDRFRGKGSPPPQDVAFALDPVWGPYRNRKP